jgi:hypothetical protein
MHVPPFGQSLALRALLSTEVAASIRLAANNPKALFIIALNHPVSRQDKSVLVGSQISTGSTLCSDDHLIVFEKVHAAKTFLRKLKCIMVALDPVPFSYRVALSRSVCEL